MDLKRLAEPFAPDDIGWRAQQVGDKNGRPWVKCLAYVTSRAVQQRLDEVCGPENWQNEFRPAPDGGLLCRIGIRVSLLNGTGLVEWVWKEDGAENTDVEGVKGGLSGAMKRAAVQWGIGRYLYDLPEGWGVVSENGRYSAKTKDGKWFKWDPPVLPDWALPTAGRASKERLLALAELAADKLLSRKQSEDLNARLAHGMTEDEADAAETWLGTLKDRVGPAEVGV